MWRTAGTFTNLRCRLPMSTPFDPPCAYNNDSTCYYNDAPQCTMCTVHCMFPPLDRARNLCTRWLPPQECDTPTVYRLDTAVPASGAANQEKYKYIDASTCLPCLTKLSLADPSWATYLNVISISGRDATTQQCALSTVHYPDGTAQFYRPSTTPLPSSTSPLPPPQWHCSSLKPLYAHGST